MTTASTGAQSADIAIVGGGPAGFCLAALLGRAGLTVAIIDRQTPEQAEAIGADGRTTAIALASQRILAAAGAWGALAEAAAPIREIRTLDGSSPLILHFDSAEIGQPFGWIVDNRSLRRSLREAALSCPGVSLLAPAVTTGLTNGAASARLTLDDGRTLDAALVVGADGRDSWLRESLGIATWGRDYGQRAIVCTAAHDQPHGGVAVEHFRGDGPFAILPMSDHQGPPDVPPCPRSSIVWTETPEVTARLLALDDAAFDAALSERFGDWLGRVRAIGGRFAYPLILRVARQFTGKRAALVGDAAHVIHPLAGQGLNLGIRDVAALAEAVIDGARLGRDPGEAALLDGYAASRMVDVMALVGVTDGLDRLFRARTGVVRDSRRLGLATVNRLGPVRRFLMRSALGEVPGAPRLARGTPL